LRSVGNAFVVERAANDAAPRMLTRPIDILVRRFPVEVVTRLSIAFFSSLALEHEVAAGPDGLIVIVANSMFRPVDAAQSPGFRVRLVMKRGVLVGTKRRKHSL
jgi:hypothetical protein